MIVKTQHIKKGMIIYLPSLKTTFEVAGVTTFKRTPIGTYYHFKDPGGIRIHGEPDYPVSVVGFAIRNRDL